MNYTVSDFYYSFKDDLKILAGADGLARSITDVGILDYEMEEGLKDKYFHSHFHENQLTIATFSCAKSNPFIIFDAAKHLISKGVSGLVIKNIFKLPIHETILRYADSKKFPILLVESQKLYIERIIYEILHHCELAKDIFFTQSKLDEILTLDLSDNEILTRAKQINPSFQDQFFTIYVKFGKPLSNTAMAAYYKRFSDSNLNTPGNTIIYRKDGFFYIHSEEGISAKYSDRFLGYILDTLLKNDSYICCGVSQYHLTLSELKTSLRESCYAALSKPSPSAGFKKYGDLGIYRFLFPFASSREMLQYAKENLEPIKDYDIENNCHLMDTLRTYINLDCDLSATAEVLCQHKNTIRYRLDKINAITRLNYKNFSHLEQLSAAIKIEQCNNSHYI